MKLLNNLFYYRFNFKSIKINLKILAQWIYFVEFQGSELPLPPKSVTAYCCTTT